MCCFSLCDVLPDFDHVILFNAVNKYQCLCGENVSPSNDKNFNLKLSTFV